MNHRDPAEHAAEVLSNALIAATAAQLAVADPTVVIASAGVAAGLQSLTPVLVASIVTRLRSFRKAMRAAEATSGRSVAELLETAVDSPLKGQLTAEVLEAAARSAVDEKIGALGRSWAIGTTSETEVGVEAQRVIVQALAAIEAPHIAILRLISTPPYRETVLSGTQPGIRSTQIRAAWTPETLADAEPQYAGLIEALVATLMGSALVKSVQGGPIPSALDPGLQLTAIGKIVLDALDSAPEVRR